MKEFEEILKKLRDNDPSLTELKLVGKKIRDLETRALAEALKGNSMLTKLRLSVNRIGDLGAQALAEALEVNGTLIELGLEYNNIKELGAQALAGALKVNSTLIALFLGKNKVGDVGAHAFSEVLKVNSTLRVLSLSIGDLSAQALAKALEVNGTLTSLGLDNIGDLSAQALAGALRINSTLVQLRLSGNKIEDLGAQALAKALEVNGTLTDLQLKKNKIGNLGAQALAEMLKVNGTLMDLNVAGNPIGDAGAQALAEALMVNNTLQHLSLSSERTLIGWKIQKLGLLALAEAALINNTLTLDSLRIELFIDHDDSRYAIQKVRPYLNILRRLLKWNETSLASSGPFDPYICAVAESGDFMSVYEYVQCGLDIHLQRQNGDTPLCLAVRKGHPVVVQSLVFHGANVFHANQQGETPMSIAMTAEPRNLQIIQCLQRTQGDTGQPKWLQETLDLLRMQQPEVLDLKKKQSFFGGQNRRVVQDHHVEALAEGLFNNESVKRVDLSGNQIGERGAKALIALLRHNSDITEIHLAHNRQISTASSDEIQQALQRNRQLERLNYRAILPALHILKAARGFLQTPQEGAPLERLPIEMKRRILSFLDEAVLLSETQITKVLEYAVDKTTLQRPLRSKIQFLKLTGCNKIAFTDEGGITFFGRRKQHVLQEEFCLSTNTPQKT